MLIKQKDDHTPTVTALRALLNLDTLNRKQRDGLREALDQFQDGVRGEKEAAYHIDFSLKEAKNWAVVHDLRLEHKGRVAQIDHLLIGRFLDVIVIESKNNQTALRVNRDEEFEVRTNLGWQGMESPVEQNRRHIQVLSSLLRDEKLLPTRLGLTIQPEFHNWVLIAPRCNLTKGHHQEAKVLKMDMFDKELERFINHSPLSEAYKMAKVCSRETVTALAERLVRFHKPAMFDHAARFGITAAQRDAPTAVARTAELVKTSDAVDAPICAHCRLPVEAKVASYCRARAERFGGKILCRTCQGANVGEAAAPVSVAGVAGPVCQECHVPVDARVEAFCRFNSRRFNKRVLCRACQSGVVAPAKGLRALSEIRP